LSKLKVRVLSVDKARRRIALSAKAPSSGARPAAAVRPGAARPDDRRAPGGARGRGPSGGFSVNPFAGL